CARRASSPRRAAFFTRPPADPEILENKGLQGFGRLSGEMPFARFHPQPIMRRIANSLHGRTATFAGFER
ncbi:hypothetical protein ACWGQ5_19450, partial [Streptomyces sp. NPDC055722]